MKAIAIVFALSIFFVTNVTAHSGGTDANGCHINHKTGIRHCH